MQAEEFFKALADGSRLKIVAALYKGPKFVEQLAKELNIGVSTVSFHLKKLEAVGIVRSKKEQYYQVYCLDRAVLDFSVSEIISSVYVDGDDGFVESVKAEFFDESGRIKRLPVQIKKREIVLKLIAERFEEGVPYGEGDTLVRIADMTDEFVAAKTEMIEKGLLVKIDGKIFRK